MEQITHSFRFRSLPSIAKLVACTNERSRAMLPKWSSRLTSICKHRHLEPYTEHLTMSGSATHDS